MSVSIETIEVKESIELIETREIVKLRRPREIKESKGRKDIRNQIESDIRFHLTVDRIEQDLEPFSKEYIDYLIYLERDKIKNCVKKISKLSVDEQRLFDWKKEINNLPQNMFMFKDQSQHYSLAKKILKILAKEEEKLKKGNEKLRYFCHDECDSNVTNFELLSNVRKIILVSRLPESKINVVFKIFQGLWDNNLWIFDLPDFLCQFDDPDDNEDQEDQIDLSEKLPSEEEIEKLGKYDPNEWLKQMERILPISSTLYEKAPKEEKGYCSQKIFSVDTIIREF